MNPAVTRPNSFDPVAGLICDPALAAIFPCEVNSDSDNFVGNISAKKTTETVTYNLTIGQSITPNSNGAEVLRFNIAGSIRKRFTQKFSLKLDALAYNQQDVGNREFERDYVLARLRLDYRLTERWGTYALYRYTWSEEENLNFLEPRNYINHFISIGFKYSNDRWRW